VIIMRTISRAAALLAMAATLGCGSDAATTTSPSATTTPSTETFTSSVAMHGSTTRSFVMSTAGTVKVDLATLGNGAVMAGLGVGVMASGAPCSLAQSIVTGPGTSPQLVTSADAGTYCIQVYDAGMLTEDTPFSLTVEHP
jgi:hypothetical protein